MNLTRFGVFFLEKRLFFQERTDIFDFSFDGISRAFGDEYFTARLAQSFENGKPNALFSLDPARIYLNWERRRNDGFSYNVSLSKAGRDYTPGMGFELRENYSSLELRLAYGWVTSQYSSRNDATIYS